MLIFWGKHVLSAKASRLSTSWRQRYFFVVNEKCRICIPEILSKDGYGAWSLLLNPTCWWNCRHLTRRIYDLCLTSTASLSCSVILSYGIEHVGTAYRWRFLMTMLRLPLLCVACKRNGDRVVGSWGSAKRRTRNSMCRFSFWKRESGPLSPYLISSLPVRWQRKYSIFISIPLACVGIRWPDFDGKIVGMESIALSLLLMKICLRLVSFAHLLV